MAPNHIGATRTKPRGTSIGGLVQCRLVEPPLVTGTGWPLFLGAIEPRFEPVVLTRCVAP